MKETDASNLLYWGDKECKQHCHSLNMIQPHTATHSLPGHGGIGREWKVKKHMGFSVRQLTGKWKTTLTNKAKQGMHPALPISGQLLSQESRGSITHNDDLGRQMLSLQTLCTHFLLYAEWCLQRYPCDHLGSAVLPLSHPNSLCTHPLLRWAEKKKSAWSYASPAQW